MKCQQFLIIVLLLAAVLGAVAAWHFGRSSPLSPQDAATLVNEIASRGKSPSPEDIGWISERLEDKIIVADDADLSAEAKLLQAADRRGEKVRLPVCDYAERVLAAQGFAGMESELAALWKMFRDRGWSSMNEWSPQDYRDAEPLLKAFATVSFKRARADDVIPKLQVVMIASEGWSVEIPKVAEAHRRNAVTTILEYVDHRDPALMKLAGGTMVLELRPQDVMKFLQAACESSRPGAAMASP